MNPLLSGIRHVCFDKDGTLIDVHKYWSHTCRLRAALIAERYGLDPSRIDGLLDAMGIEKGADRIKKGGPVGYQPRPVIIESVLRFLRSQSRDVSADDMGALFREIDARQQATGDYRIEMLPGARESVARLKERNVVLTIYSSDRRENVLKLLENFSLGDYFSDVVGGGCVGDPKPHPEGFLTACKRVGVSPAESAYVGDTVEDLRMGKLGGAGRCIGVTTGLNTLEELRAEGGDVVDRLEALTEG